MVVHAAELVASHQLKDGACRCGGDESDRLVVDETVCGAGDQEPPVRERRPQTRAVPVVGESERLGQRVVERQLVFGPEPQRRGDVGRRRFGVSDGFHDRSREAVVRTVGVLQMTRMPALWRGQRTLQCAATTLDRDCRAIGQRLRQLLPVRTHRWPLATVKGGEVAVVGMVFHHQQHHVLNLRDQVYAGRPGRLWPRAGEHVIGSVVKPAHASGGHPLRESQKTPFHRPGHDPPREPINRAAADRPAIVRQLKPSGQRPYRRARFPVERARWSRSVRPCVSAWCRCPLALHPKQSGPAQAVVPTQRWPQCSQPPESCPSGPSTRIHTCWSSRGARQKPQARRHR
jgi:hypothetical protein